MKRNEPRGSHNEVTPRNPNDAKIGASMIVILEAGTPSTRRNRIRSRLEQMGVRVQLVDGGERTYFEVFGDDLPIRTLKPSGWNGVEKVVPLTPSHPHCAWGGGRENPVTPTVVEIGADPDSRVRIGDGAFAVVAGPCAVEDGESAVEIGRAVQQSGATLYRGGAFKPRTSPYAFQGLEAEGLAILADVKSQTGLPIVTEVLDTQWIDRVSEVADVLQVGSRNMQNYALLKELGKIRKPVLLKRGFAATVEELLLSAEYILSGGNDQVVLCERGIRSAAGGNSVILDLGAIPEIRHRSHLPVLVDPSHSAVSAHRVGPLARAAVAAGADGLLIEVHRDREFALSDGQQALHPQEFERLMKEVAAIRKVLRPGASHVNTA